MPSHEKKQFFLTFFPVPLSNSWTTAAPNITAELHSHLPTKYCWLLTHQDFTLSAQREYISLFFNSLIWDRLQQIFQVILTFINQSFLDEKSVWFITNAFERILPSSSKVTALISPLGKKLQKLIFWNHLTTTLTKQARLSDKNIDKNTLFWKNGTMTTFNIFSK